MKKVRLIGFMGGLVTLVLIGDAAKGAVTPGAIVDLDASASGADSNRWANIGTLGGSLGFSDVGDNVGIPPVRTIDTVNNVVFYSPGPDNSKWGNEGAAALASAPAITGLNDWTMETWVRRTANSPAGSHEIFGLNNTSDFNQRFWAFWDDPTANGNASQIPLDLFIKGQTDAGLQLNNVVNVATGEWMQLAFTFNDAADALKVYKNGVLVTNVTAAMDFDPAQEMKRLTLFRVTVLEPDGRYFHGDISRFRLYTTELSASQILDNFEFGNATPPQLIPEPSTCLLLAAGAAMLFRMQRVRGRVNLKS